MHALLAIDQGTTGTTSIVVDITRGGPVKILGRGYAEFKQHFDRPGEVEHDLEDIWQSVLISSRQAMAAAQVPPAQLRGVSLTNQRETTAVWNRQGKPLHRALVWQDRRTTQACQARVAQGHAPMVKSRTGLVMDPYFSASKLQWLIANDRAVAAAAKAGELVFGTIDSWLIWKLTAGAHHRTDTTNAARTLLFDIHKEQWDPQLLALWDDIPADCLAEVLPSDATFGHTRGIGHIPDGVPITGVAGDQNAALVGQACVEVGMAKCTLGTGAFLLVNTGDKAITGADGLLSTLGWRTRKHRAYAVEGSIFVAGAMVQWLRDNLRLIKTSADIEPLACEVSNSEGVVVVPALTGLGAPHWRSDARGLIGGLSRGSTAAHVARATLEGIAMQTVDLADTMRAAGALTRGALRVDGGAAVNNLLLQMHADNLGLAVERPACVETTALGAAYLGALGTGAYTSMADIAEAWQVDRRFEPSVDDATRAQRLATWRAQVARA